MKQNLIKNQESATVQSAKQNVQDEPTAESGSAKPAEAANEPQAGGGSAPSPCSAVRVRPDGASKWSDYLRKPISLFDNISLRVKTAFRVLFCKHMGIDPLEVLYSTPQKQLFLSKILKGSPNLRNIYYPNIPVLSHSEPLQVIALGPERVSLRVIAPILYCYQRITGIWKDT